MGLRQRTLCMFRHRPRSRCFASQRGGQPDTLIVRTLFYHRNERAVPVAEPVRSDVSSYDSPVSYGFLVPTSSHSARFELRGTPRDKQGMYREARTLRSVFPERFALGTLGLFSCQTGDPLARRSSFEQRPWSLLVPAAGCDLYDLTQVAGE